LTNALTIDVEDYFQVSAFDPHIARSDWERQECRVERNVDRILELLGGPGVHATFFTLGWIAERYPGMVRRIVDAGHEVASHGYLHERASDLDESRFRADIRRAKRVLEDVSGAAVAGYRAPSFSIGRHNAWAFDCLGAEGYRYSSSVYPIRHDHYGDPDAPRFAHRVAGGVLEIPATTVRVLHANLPSSGGGYFRLLPYPVSRWMLRRVNDTDGEPTIFYFHPWEIDFGQPRIRGLSAATRFRHYVNIGDPMTQRLERLLRDFRWGRVDRVFGSRMH
jgi:polysaccharide deacetylase family protein (PEP-CTERM system associated)